MKNLKFICISIIFFAVFSLTLVFFKVTKESSVLVDIPEGSTISLISNILFAEGLILNPILFKAYTRLTLSDNKLQAGEYLIDSSQSVYTLNKKLLEGDFYYRKLTLLPGSTLKTILNLANSAGLVAPDTVSPLIPGSDFAMFNSTNGGASTEIGSSFQITTSQFS